MIYLDYSATTPVDERVLDSYCKTTREYIGNANSMHTLGVKSKELEDYATCEIAKMLHVKPSEVIYTSGASESNNTAIKGICLKYQNRGKHIITTRFEHSSIYGPISYLQKQGFEVDFVESNDDGTVNVAETKRVLKRSVKRSNSQGKASKTIINGLKDYQGRKGYNDCGAYQL